LTEINNAYFLKK